MGGCASKPKGLKAELDKVPEPAPAKDVAAAVPLVDEETREVVKVDEAADGEVDENGNNRKPLSVLFKESEEGKESITDDKNQSETVVTEQVKVEEPKSDSTVKEENKEAAADTQKIETKTEEAVTVETAPETVETEKPIVESEELAKSEEKKIEEEKEAVPAVETVETEKPAEVAKPIEPELLEKSDENKTKVEEETEEGVVATPVPVETEKPAEPEAVEKSEEEKTEGGNEEVVKGVIADETTGAEAALPGESQKIENSEQKKQEGEDKVLANEDGKVTENVSEADARREEPATQA